MHQQDERFFPLPFQSMPAQLHVETIPAQEWLTINGFRIYAFPQLHPGGSYGYRIEDDQTCLVYATDAEYKRVDPTSTEASIKLFQGADLLVFDAQYSLSEALDRVDWGHSSALVGAELAWRAAVKRMALFHHDPSSSDEQIWAAREQAEAYLVRRYHQHLAGKRAPCQVLVAYDGLHLHL